MLDPISVKKEPIKVPPSSPKKQTSNRPAIISILSVVALIMVLIAGISRFVYPKPITICSMFHLTCPPTSTPSPSIGVQIMPITETIEGKPVTTNIAIGISDGRYFFDQLYDDPKKTKNQILEQEAAALPFKKSAAQALLSGNTASAKSLWSQAFNVDSADGEACIYQENLQLTRPSFTLVLATTLSQTALDKNTSLLLGRDDIQGVCLKQRAYNDNAAHQPNARQVRILIANIGTKELSVLSQTVKPVTQQITQLTQNDSQSPFIGLVGFPFSKSVKPALDILNPAHIPVVSPAAASSEFSAQWSYFHRIVASDSSEGSYDAKFASTQLRASTAVVLIDSTDSYSKTLGESFADAFRANGGTPTTQPFTENNPDTFNLAITSMRSNPPSMVFCSCFADDLIALRNMIQANNLSSSILIMGGGALYELGPYTDNYTDIYFSSPAFPDTIANLCPQGKPCSLEQSQFYTNYCKTFGPQDYKDGHCDDYGRSRPGPHVMLSYDAVSALLNAYDASSPSAGNITRQDIETQLANLSFQGVSGQISFSSSGLYSDPNNKTILMLCVDSGHHTHLVDVYGQFLEKDSPTFSPHPDVCK